MTSEITVTLDIEATRALLRALERCQACGSAPAELRLSEPGCYSVAVCTSCATMRTEARVEPLSHAPAVGAIEAALLRAAGLPA